MIAFGMRGHRSILFHKSEGISRCLNLTNLPILCIRPRVTTVASGACRGPVPGVITPRKCLSCLSGSDVENRREHVRSFFNLQQNSLLSKLVYPGTGRQLSTSCNPLKGEIKQERNGDGLIYNGPLTKMVCLVKFFSLSTSIISTGLIATLVISNDGGVMTYVAGGISSLMIFTPVILHWFTKGYVTHMYYNHTSNTYTVCTFDFFLRNVKTEFKQSDVSLPTVTNAISSFLIHNKPVLVDPRGFINPNHYSYLMGYTDYDGNVNLEKKSNLKEFK